MVAHNLDIPQITVADNQDDNSSSSLDNTSFLTSGPPMCHAISPSDTHDFLPHSTLVVTNYRTHPDVTGPPALRTSDTTSSPSPGQCIAQCAHSSTRQDHVTTTHGASIFHHHPLVATLTWFLTQGEQRSGRRKRRRQARHCRTRAPLCGG